jgi:hypothetical protein
MILLGGNFMSYEFVTRHHTHRLDANLVSDSGFSSPMGSLGTEVLTFGFQNSGQILIGGNFTTPKPALLRSSGSGAIDTTFNNDQPAVSSSGIVYDVATLPNNQALVAGKFANYSGATANGLVRLHPDGTRDSAFSAVPPNLAEFRAALRLPDGKIIVGGEFATVNGNPANRVALLDENGATLNNLDIGSGPNGRVNTLATVSDGVVAAGAFTSVSGEPRPNAFKMRYVGGNEPLTIVEQPGHNRPSRNHGGVYRGGDWCVTDFLPMAQRHNAHRQCHQPDLDYRECTVCPGGQL